MPRSGVRGFRGDKLRELRVKANFTPDDLAARIGSTRQAVSTWETGRSRPAPETLGLLAEALDTSISVLVPIPDSKLRMSDLRVRAALNQRNAAMRLGIGATTLAEIESGIKQVRDDLVDKIAELYEMDGRIVAAAWKRGCDQRETRAKNL
ncbi:MAG: helix-turn-helix transcriptional regulator [Rhodococcus sp. (in: high G+C Gram-positive bacteria)]|uniref:helix-turn-helix domain-containing protein n=1 Tax=Rhodococcus sp. TaxID=1831 RepID=UPI003BB133CD